MKAWEILKKENNGKEYTSEDKTYKVIYRIGDDGVYLYFNGSLVSAGEWLFNAEFEEVKPIKSGWLKLEEKYKQDYYYIDEDGSVEHDCYDLARIDIERENNLNTFSTKEKAEEVAREQLLYRLIKRFRDENDEYVDWMNDARIGFSIRKDIRTDKYIIEYWTNFRGFHTIYFTTEELAYRCLQEVVLPFLKDNNLK